ncbi:MAG: carboxypeptidase regulatory-like domain-containing protein, partial [Bacteroidota bacterium]
IEAVSPPLSLVRVIDVTPVATSPQGGETLATAQPQLTWAPVRLPYAFTYRLAVTRLDSGIETTVWTAQEVPSTETSIQVSVPLTSGVTYNWTLSVVDAFGNESRSKPAGFILSR